MIEREHLHDASLGKDTNLNSPVYFREWFRVIERVWGGYLTTSAKSIVWMVFDRTLGWGKEWERIPLRHFTDGVMREEGRFLTHPGTGLNRSTVRVWLEALVAGEVLLKQGESTYSLNYDWSPKRITQDMREPKNQTPEKRKGSLAERKPTRKPWEDDQEKAVEGVEFPPKRGEFSTKRGGNSTPIREGKEREGKTKRDPASPKGGELGKTLDRIQNQNKTKKEERRNKKEENIPPSEQVGRLFDDLRLAAFPDIAFPATRKTDASILKKFAFRWCRRGDEERRLSYSDFKDFLDWALTRWTTLMLNRFAWVDNAPHYPEVRFMVGLSDHFLRAYQEKQRVDALVGLTPQQAYAARLRQDGVSENDAREAAEERFRDHSQAERLKRERHGLERAREGLAVASDRKAQADERESMAKERQERIDRYRSVPAPSGRFVWKEEEA